MSQTSATYQSKLYQSFLTIDEREHRSIVRFYSDNWQKIEQLEFRERYDVTIAYTTALFEIGQYEKHLAMAEEAIELTIMNNIKIHKGFNIFQQLLFQKSVSHFHLMEYAQSEHILHELIKICPSEDKYSDFLKKVMLRRIPNFIQHIRACSIFFFMLSAGVILVEILIVRNFFLEWISIIEWTRSLLFLAGWLVLLGGYAYLYWNVSRKIHAFIKKVKKEKLNRQRKRHQRQHLLM